MSSRVVIICAILAICIFQVNAIKKSKKPTVVGPSMYDRLHRYTVYASASYQRHCPDPPFNSTIMNTIDIVSTDTQATLFRDDKHKRLVLAFPGTRGVNDSRRNDEGMLTPYRTFSVGRKHCPGCMVHTGWLGAWNAIGERAIDAVATALKKHPKYKVIITGHSMGGALSSLAYGSFKSANYPVAAAYTFGQPRTGNKQYADFIDHLAGVKDGSKGHFHRVTHTDDGVPQVPDKSIGGYHHHSTEYWEKNDNSGSQSRKMTFRCYDQEPTNCNEATGAKAVINNAHGNYSGVNMGESYVCHQKQHKPN